MVQCRDLCLILGFLVHYFAASNLRLFFCVMAGFESRFATETWRMDDENVGTYFGFFHKQDMICHFHRAMKLCLEQRGGVSHRKPGKRKRILMSGGRPKREQIGLFQRTWTSTSRPFPVISQMVPSPHRCTRYLEPAFRASSRLVARSCCSATVRSAPFSEFLGARPRVYASRCKRIRDRQNGQLTK